MNRYQLMCDDLEKARKNRERIKSGYATAWWIELEQTIKATPIGANLPSSVPIGQLPQVGKEITREHITYGIDKLDEEV